MGGHDAGPCSRCSDFFESSMRTYAEESGTRNMLTKSGSRIWIGGASLGARIEVPQSPRIHVYGVVYGEGGV